MARENIYIRKENEDFWKSVKNKSDYVNAVIAVEKAGHKLGHENVGRLKDEINKRVTLGVKWDSFKPCKHGADPKFCKFAKNGKPCNT